MGSDGGTQFRPWPDHHVVTSQTVDHTAGDHRKRGAHDDLHRDRGVRPAHAAAQIVEMVHLPGFRRIQAPPVSRRDFCTANVLESAADQQADTGTDTRKGVEIELRPQAVDIRPERMKVGVKLKAHIERLHFCGEACPPIRW
ncbi:hypothetical protein SAMN05444746_101831 [Variovorax sp. OK212]|nr:hypothetical protein SAMN05518853_101831 [Variovorax sp. OK202]SFC07226.1 hypothetical protein SAMN05444746_101831 [Variovorax sp. OK212]